MNPPTARELAAIHALTTSGKGEDPWRFPIHAVNRALQLSSSESRALAEDLIRRGHVRVRTKALNPADPTDQGPQLFWWEVAPTGRGE
jgi:hypothetical protein